MTTLIGGAKTRGRKTTKSASKSKSKTSKPKTSKPKARRSKSKTSKSKTSKSKTSKSKPKKSKARRSKPKVEGKKRELNAFFKIMAVVRPKYGKVTKPTLGNPSKIAKVVKDEVESDIGKDDPNKVVAEATKRLNSNFDKYKKKAGV